MKFRQKLDHLNGNHVHLNEKLNHLNEKLNYLNEKLERIERYALATAQRFAINCGQGEILIRTAVGYVLVDSGDHALISALVENQELEPGLRVFLEKTILPGFRVVDVGANIGMHTITMARSLRGNGVVYSFEPMPRTFELLNTNIRINGLSSLVILHPTALSDYNGNNILYLGCTSGHHSLFPLDDLSDPANDSIEVHVGTLDYSLANVQEIDLIKIDAEGSELDVISGGAEILHRSQNILVVVEFGLSHLLRAGHSPMHWFSQFETLTLSHRVINNFTGAVENWTMEKILEAESVNLVFGRTGSKIWNKISAQSS